MLKIIPHHLTLQDLIEKLEAYPYADKVIPIGFYFPHSYRGIPKDVAFCTKENATPGAMLECAKRAMNNTYEGYKGGEYTMVKDTKCWLVNRHKAYGESLGSLLLALLLRFSSNG